MSDNLYTVGPRKARELIEDVIQAGLVPYVHSSPGAGKSSIMKAIAGDYNLHLIDHRLSTSEPTDLTGLPRFMDGYAEFVPFRDIFPVVGDPIPKGKDGFMLFLDEFPSMPKAVQAACFKLVLDRMVGQRPLHPNTVITAAGNLSTDRAITNNLSTPMQSRLIHIEMVVSFKEWLEDVALPEQYDSRIIAFLSRYNSKLMDFQPDHNEKTFCCPRTWSFMNQLIKGREVTEEKAALYAGTITSGVAVEFIQFTKIFKNLPSVGDIVRDPQNCPVPGDPSTCWATIAHMMEKVDESNLGPLAEFANRFDLSFRILFFRSVRIRNPKLENHPAFVKAMIELSKYLYA